MFTDTHCHLSYLGDRGINLPELLAAMVEQDFALVIDAGTRCADITERKQLISAALEAMESPELRQKAHDSIWYSVGVWPDAGAIQNRAEEIKILEKSLLEHNDRIVAIGECGLDHHWNTNGVDPRTEEQFTPDLQKAEQEFFEMQLELAKKYEKPVVVHSRDAFEQTVDAIKNIGYHNGEIHCYSYGLAEAKVFLDAGWYIALGGGVTYTKRSKMDAMKELIRYIPRDRLLLETDGPYLCPVPHRGKTNTPLYVPYTYEFIADILEMSSEKLQGYALENARRLFHI